MANNRHKNRRALIVRLDKAAEDSLFVGDGLEGMILSVDEHMQSLSRTDDFYSGEILHLPKTSTSPCKGKVGVRGSYTVLFSRKFNKNEKHKGGWSYGESRL